MASDSGSRNDAAYESAWIARKTPVPGVWFGSRPPRVEDCPTGCAAVDFMLQSCLPLKQPVPLLEENNALYMSHNYQDNNDANNMYQEELKQFRYDTRKYNGNNNLGNFTSEEIISASRKGLHDNPDRMFYGNSHDSTTEYLSFIKAILKSIPSTPGGRGVLSVIKKAKGAKFGVNNRNTMPKLPPDEDGGMLTYCEDHLAKHNQVYMTVVAQNASALNDLRYPAISTDPLAAAGTPQVVGALIGSSTSADGTARIGAGAQRIPSSLAKTRLDEAQAAYGVPPILTGLGHHNQRDRMHQQALVAASVHYLTTTQEAAVTSMVPLDAVISRHNIECIDAQMLCAAESGSELDKM